MILSNDKPPPTLRLDKKSNVEEPLLEPLQSLGLNSQPFEAEIDAGANLAHQPETSTQHP